MYTSSVICRKCAECCKNYPYVKLSNSDIDLIEKVAALHFDIFSNPKGDNVEEHFLKFQGNGDCYFLIEENGSYSCGVYAARPEICKKYPSKPIQEKFCFENLRTIRRNTFE